MNMTAIVLTDEIYELIRKALFPEWNKGELSRPILEPDGGITVDNGDQIMLALYPESHYELGDYTHTDNRSAAVVKGLNAYFSGTPTSWSQAYREQFIVHALPYLHFSGTPQWGIGQYLTTHLGVNPYRVPNAIRAARIAITRFIRSAGLNAGEPILRANKTSGPDRHYSPHPALEEALRQFFAQHHASHHYFGSTMIGYLEGNE